MSMFICWECLMLSLMVGGAFIKKMAIGWFITPNEGVDRAQQFLQVHLMRQISICGFIFVHLELIIHL